MATPPPTRHTTPTPAAHLLTAGPPHDTSATPPPPAPAAQTPTGSRVPAPAGPPAPPAPPAPAASARAPYTGPGDPPPHALRRPRRATPAPTPHIPDLTTADPTTAHGRDARVPRVLRAPCDLRVLAGVLLAVVLLGLAHQARPVVPYGDRLVSHARVERQAGSGAWVARARGAAVVGADTRTGVPRWRYARVGHRPVAVLAVRPEVIALWDDGLLTDTDGRSVRWHRALPDAAEWLPSHGGTGVLRSLGHGMLAVVAPPRVTAYRMADGDLRWLLPAGPSCAFRPEGAVRRGAALLIAQPCARGAWTGQLVALDDLGRITPDRTPLGNDLPGHGPNVRA
ncbi:hypothetical protein [Streptomyces alanosinicus]|uniref:Uncharacterized protein n=1 Tax=Streptomyces alanosinicus TaxID=68171 RepID=A0A919D4N7_9ACTN|nr:hypothetical protein [Streptomyces alanosinicus]GHE10103.1 hypothetical protein GCM10010339_65060 [Streptomyces alanosinicus]